MSNEEAANLCDRAPDNAGYRNFFASDLKFAKKKDILTACGRALRKGA